MNSSLKVLHKAFAFFQVLGFHPFVFDKLNRGCQCELSSAITIFHMNMNRLMFIRLEEKV